MRTSLVASGLILTLSACRAMFPTEAGNELAHFDTEAPRPGSQAPDIDLFGVDGKALSLSSLVGDKPVVLLLGSHSCPVYRYRHRDYRQLQEQYRGRVEFVTVYTLEAHPTGSNSPYRDEEWITAINRLTGVRIDQPGAISERIERARSSASDLPDSSIMLVDGMDNRAWSAYGSAPSPAFVIDSQGVIALRQVWFNPLAMRDTLDRLLGDSPESLP